MVVTREENNEADPRAIVCTVSSTGDNTDKNFLGYVPRQVSTHLSPVLDAGLITVSATVFCSQREQLVETGKESGGLASEIAVELSLEEYGAESHGQIASVWCAASDAARDVRIGLREVLRQRFWTAFDRIERDLLTSSENCRAEHSAQVFCTCSSPDFSFTTTEERMVLRFDTEI